jgi:hypothetical protein
MVPDDLQRAAARQRLGELNPPEHARLDFAEDGALGEGRRINVARHTIAEDAAAPAWTDSRDARLALAEEIQRSLHFLGPLAITPDPYAADKLLAEYLSSLGPSGVQSGAAWRRLVVEREAASGDAFINWRFIDRLGAPLFTDLAPALRQLAFVLWADVVFPKLRHERGKAPALVMAVAEPVAHLFSPARREEEKNGQRALRLSGDVLVRLNAAAVIDAQSLNAIMANRGIKLYGSVASHRVLRWEIFTAHRQALEKNPDPRVLRFEGGWAPFAYDELKMKGGKAAEQVRDIIEAQHATEIPLPPDGEYSRLLIRETHTPRGRGQQWIKLILGTALLPDYVHELQQAMGAKRGASRASRLVPILDLPPFVGDRQNEYGAQATLSMLVVAHIRDYARDLVLHAGVVIDQDTFRRLGREAGLPPDSVCPIIDRWTQDGTDAPALLKRVAVDRYTLGDAYVIQREFIERGGRSEIDGQIGGLKAVARRDSRRERLRRHAG